MAPITMTGLLSVLSHARSVRYQEENKLGCERATIREKSKPLGHSPSKQVNSWATMRRSISRCACSRLPVMASISSMNRMHGAAFCVCI